MRVRVRDPGDVSDLVPEHSFEACPVLDVRAEQIDARRLEEVLVLGGRHWATFQFGGGGVTAALGSLHRVGSVTNHPREGIRAAGGRPEPPRAGPPRGAFTACAADGPARAGTARNFARHWGRGRAPARRICVSAAITGGGRADSGANRAIFPLSDDPGRANHHRPLCAVRRPAPDPVRGPSNDALRYAHRLPRTVQS